MGMDGINPGVSSVGAPDLDTEPVAVDTGFGPTINGALSLSPALSAEVERLVNEEGFSIEQEDSGAMNRGTRVDADEKRIVLGGGISDPRMAAVLLANQLRFEPASDLQLDTVGDLMVDNDPASPTFGVLRTDKVSPSEIGTSGEDLVKFIAVTNEVNKTAWLHVSSGVDSPFEPLPVVQAPPPVPARPELSSKNLGPELASLHGNT